MSCSIYCWARHCVYEGVSLQIESEIALACHEVMVSKLIWNNLQYDTFKTCVYNFYYTNAHRLRNYCTNASLAYNTQAASLRVKLLISGDARAHFPSSRTVGSPSILRSHAMEVTSKVDTNAAPHYAHRKTIPQKVPRIIF